MTNGTPEARIIREMFRTKKGGTTPKSNPREYGTIVEMLITRELQAMAARASEQDVRFARGYVVEDYGSATYEGASAANAGSVSTAQSPRFDIICYRGDVAWTAYDGIPHAMVPASFVYGVIEVKRTLSPSAFDEETTKDINPQLRAQREHLDRLEIDGPHILIGAHHWSTSADEVRRHAAADSVVFIGDIRSAKVKQGAAEMACPGAIERVLTTLTSG